MPKILNHTPWWLTRPSAGFDFFQPGPQTKAPLALSNGQGRKLEHQGPCRTIAHRGTEVFVVVGNEIRWSDLISLRDSASKETAVKSSLATAPTTTTSGTTTTETDDAAAAAAAVYRVSAAARLPQLASNAMQPRGTSYSCSIRYSRRPLLARSGSLSSRRWETTWPF